MSPAPTMGLSRQVLTADFLTVQPDPTKPVTLSGAALAGQFGW